MSSLQNYGVVIRLYPNKEQKQQIIENSGSSRFVYNQLLNQYNEDWNEFLDLVNEIQEEYNIDNSMSLKDFMKEYKDIFDLKYPKLQEYSSLKAEYEFLNEVDSLALANSKQNLNTAISNSIKSISKVGKAKYHKPNFKKKSYKYSYQTNNILTNKKKNNKIIGKNESIKLLKENRKFYITLPKIGKVITSKPRNFSGRITTVTVTMDEVGKCYASLQIDNSDNFSPSTKLNSDILGLDVGIIDTIITSNGDKLGFSSKTKVKMKKLGRKSKCYQRQMARRTFNGKNYHKARINKTKIDKKLKNIIKDNNHKIVNKTLSLSNHFHIEDLKVKKMKERKQKATSLQRFSLSELLNILEYKAESQGQIVKRISANYASTQLCSSCGYQNKQLKNNCAIRTWTCPECNSEHDRDINAAINIRDYKFA